MSGTGLRVSAFTGGQTVPSARFRVRQLVPALHELGVEVVEWPSRAGAYPPPGRIERPLWALGNLASRMVDVLRAGPAQVTLLQREFLSSHVTLERLTRAPRVLDVDDAIWLYGGERFARRLAGLCDMILCGNGFLAEWFGARHREVRILPTGVDTERFRPAGAGLRCGAPVIGWSGTSSTLVYLDAIEPALRSVFDLHPSAVVRVVCDTPPRLASLPPERVEFVRWSPEVEVGALQGMTIGLMPLDDSIASRGKCSLKMLLYMACGVPVVVSPVGSNQEILEMGSVGLAARSNEDWVECIDRLLRQPDDAAGLARRARELIVERFSVNVLARQLADLLRAVARH